MSLSPLEVLYEQPGLPALDLPDQLRRWYGGSLGFGSRRLFGNFVASLDGVVAIPGLASSNRLISGGSAADRFVMGLLRACADVVLIGSGTMRAASRTTWTADDAFPAGADSFAALRSVTGRPPVPEVAIVTATGDLDPGHPVLRRRALVLTTDGGASALSGRLPAETTVVSLGRGAPVDPQAVVRCLHERGHRWILCEAGPRLFGSLLSQGLVDELFVTQSPILAGRSVAQERLGLIAGVDLLPDVQRAGRLLSVRRHGDHLLLRYELGQASPTPATGR